jgi:peroxiredoxin
VAARQQYAAKGLEIAGIGVDQADKLRTFAKDYGVSYPVLVADGDISGLLEDLGDRAAALPYSVLLDEKRRVTYRKLGIWSEKELEREIKAAIG